MTISEYIYRKTPKYYPNMYLDGYNPAQIRQAVVRDMMAEQEEQDNELDVHITSEVKKK